MQTRMQSFIESVAGTFVAFALSTFIQPHIMHHVAGCYFNYTISMYVAIIFTAISFVRSYIVRRVFNWFHHGRKYG